MRVEIAVRRTSWLQAMLQESQEHLQVTAAIFVCNEGRGADGQQRSCEAGFASVRQKVSKRAWCISGTDRTLAITDLILEPREPVHKKPKRQTQKSAARVAANEAVASSGSSGTGAEGHKEQKARQVSQE